MASSFKLLVHLKYWLRVNPLSVGRSNLIRCLHDVSGSQRESTNSDKFHPKSDSNSFLTVKKPPNCSQNLDSMPRKTKPEDAINNRIWTIPNGLCLSRILASPVLAYTIINNQHLASVLICFFAGITDFFDGFIARRYESQRSTLGGILDPVADKILVTTLYISTTISGQIPILLTSIVLGRDLILIVGASVKRYQLMSQPRSLAQYFKLKGLNMEVKASTISKWNTGFQFLLIGLTVSAPLAPLTPIVASLLVPMQYLVAGTTIASGVDYIRNSDNYISPVKSK